MATYTIAFKYDSSGFIILLENISMVYFFISDTVIFHERFNENELLGVAVILFVVIAVTICKIKEQKKPKEID